MTRLTDLLNATPSTRDIDKRNYIGASSIGSQCVRALWYGLYSQYKPEYSAQLLRTFEVGKRLEAMLLDCLDLCGLEIQRPNKDNAFLAVADKEVSLFQGHMDALWVNEGILEIKTARDASFRVFQKKGLRLWYPVYYAQVQAYMGMSGIVKAYVLAINKDTSEVHDECVTYDAGYYETLRAKAKKIIELDKAPCRVNESPLYFVCKMCAYRKVCHQQ